jgi:hypothetical protein
MAGTGSTHGANSSVYPKLSNDPAGLHADRVGHVVRLVPIANPAVQAKTTIMAALELAGI